MKGPYNRRPFYFTTNAAPRYESVVNADKTFGCLLLALYITFTENGYTMCLRLVDNPYLSSIGYCVMVC